MNATLTIPVLVFSILVFFYVRRADALKCYVCQDCSESFGSEHVQNCTRNVDRCIKMVLANGDVDRLCAEKNEKHKCTGRGNGRSKRSIEDELDDYLPKRRVVRQLLGGDGGGGGGGGGGKNKNKGGGSKAKAEEKPGVKEASEVYCCGEDGCNGALGLSSLNPSLLLIMPVILAISLRSFQSLGAFWGLL